MADTNLLKRSTQGNSADGDPFAELTRIMGRDPRAEAAEDPFDIDLEKELMGGFEDEFGAAEPAPGDDAEPVAEAAADYEPQPAAEEAEEEPAAATHDDLSSHFDDLDWGVPQADADSQSPAPMQPDFPLDGGDEPDAVPAAEAVEDEIGLAEVDMDFGDLDIANETAAADANGEQADAVSQDAAEAEPRGYGAEAPAAEASLEDELNMLLAGSGAEEDAAAAYQDEDAYREPDSDDRYADGQQDSPHIPLYGRANFAREDHARDVSEWEVDASAEEPAMEAAAADEPVTEAVAEEIIAEEIEAQPAADPFAVFSNIAPAMPVFHRPVSAASSNGAAGSRHANPEIETVDVAEAAVPAQDDLDLPDTAFEEPAPAIDDYDADFAEAFGAVNGHAEAAEPAAAQAAGEDDRYFAEALGFGGASAATAAAGWGSTYRPASAVDVADAGDTHDETPEREIDVAAYGAATSAARQRRTGMTVALAVLGVAVIGGLGAFALSFGGGDADDTPVLVKADNEPLKVKPEEPGGMSVPNQDSKAYERAAGVVDDTPPMQEKLVNTTEEPVNLASADETDAPLPGVDEDVPAMAASDADAGAGAKGEDRLAASDEPAGVGAVEDLAAVQPRKVRTMIVKPDGTLVPREEPEPAPAQQVAAAAAVAASGPQQGAMAPAAQPAAEVAAPAAEAIREVATKPLPAATGTADAAEPAAKAAAAEPTVVTPETGPIAPSRPSNQPAETVSPQPQQQARQQVAQAAPALARSQPAETAAPVTGASPWSMQIASQPTAEAAQESYQNLARRYGGVIGGRGVNIVKADIPNKGTYYRVRIPSASRDEAVALCEKYKAAGGSCFVSK